MGFKQPRVPEYQKGDEIEKYIRRLILFLKDFCREAWAESRAQGKAIDALQRMAESAEAMANSLETDVKTDSEETTAER